MVAAAELLDALVAMAAGAALVARSGNVTGTDHVIMTGPQLAKRMGAAAASQQRAPTPEAARKKHSSLVRT